MKIQISDNGNFILFLINNQPLVVLKSSVTGLYVMSNGNLRIAMESGNLSDLYIHYTDVTSPTPLKSAYDLLIMVDGILNSLIDKLLNNPALAAKLLAGNI
jgi:hypothetical protein